MRVWHVFRVQAACVSGEAKGEVMSKPTEGYVYFCLSPDDQFIKIGYTRNPKHRMYSLRYTCKTLYGCKLRMIGVLPGTYRTEHWLQTTFRNDRTHGDLFRYSERIKSWLSLVTLLPPCEEKYPSILRAIEGMESERGIAT